MFTHGKIGCYIEKHVHLNDNNHYYYPYRAFGGQNKIVYSRGL